MDLGNIQLPYVHRAADRFLTPAGALLFGTTDSDLKLDTLTAHDHLVPWRWLVTVSTHRRIMTLTFTFTSVPFKAAGDDADD